MGRRIRLPIFLSLPIALVMCWVVYQGFQRSRRTGCEAILVQLRGALRDYQLDHGQLPPNLTALTKPAGSAYFKYTENGKVMDQVLDPWGHPFVYRIHRREGVVFKGKVANDDRFELYAIGPNGIDEGGKGDDVSYDD